MKHQRGRGQVCAYCGRHLEGAGSRSSLMATRDHVVPKCRGGSHTVWACFTCNTLKGDMAPERWRKFMADNPEWWRDGPRPFHRAKRRCNMGLKFNATPDDVRAMARQIVAETG